MLRLHLAEHFKKRRLEMGLTVAEVAQRAGYKNVSKGMRRIEVFERAGLVDSALFAKLAAVLGVDSRTTSRLAYKDYRDWLVLMNIPVAPRLFRRALHGGGVVRVPKRFKTVEASERYAAHFARQRGTVVCLMLSGRIKLWFAADGSLTEIVEEVPDDC